jgi:2-polyprenyl-3-methyl-5-hydroxy-6-metoxy-1,4-benzoquinol methylase
MSWDDQAAGWDDNPAVRTYADAAYTSLLALLAEHGRSLDGARVLDFGCGTGLLTVAMAAHADVVGLDLSPAMVAVLDAKGHPRVTAVAGGLDAVEGTFDLVTCSSVCAFVPDYPGTVAALAARLNPGGLFVQWDWELDPSAEEPYGLTRAGIAAALEAAGLTHTLVRTGFEAVFEDMTMAPLLGAGLRATSPG